MSTPPGVERLSDSRYIVMILRVLVDKENRVLQGEVGGADQEEWIRFRGANGLPGAVQSFISRSLGSHLDAEHGKGEMHSDGN